MERSILYLYGLKPRKYLMHVYLSHLQKKNQHSIQFCPEAENEQIHNLQARISDRTKQENAPITLWESQTE